MTTAATKPAAQATPVGAEPGAALAGDIKPPAKVDRRYKVVVFMPNGGDPYFQNKSYGYVKAGQELGVDVEIYDAGGYENVTKQIAQVEDAIQRKVDAIVLTATNAAALSPVAENAVNAGIPVINDDVLVSTDKVNTKISENSVNVGYQEMEYIARKLNGKGNVVNLAGPPGADISIARLNGAKMALQKYPDIKVVAEQFYPSNIVAATKMMEDFIQANPQIHGVYTFNAVSALGAAQALKAAGKRPGTADWPVVATIDLHPELERAMKDNEIQSVVPAEPVKLAYTSIVLAVKAKQGEQIPKRVYTQSEDPLEYNDLAKFDKTLAVAPADYKPQLR
jgi:ABC-type sugar transport system substrate-binding protein